MHRSLFAVVLPIVAIAVHYFVALWFVGTVPWLRARKRTVVRVAMGLSLLAPAGRLMGVVSHGDFVVTLIAVGVTEWMIVLLGAIPLGLTRLGFLVFYRLSRGSRAASPEMPRDVAAPVLSRREAVERVAGALAFGASTTMLGWGMVRGRHEFALEEVPVRLPGSPRSPTCTRAPLSGSASWARASRSSAR
jgi:hypothetical protein